MSHYTVLLRFERGNLEEGRTKIEEMLAPFNENTEVPRYKKYPSDDAIQRMAKHYKVEPTDTEALSKHMMDWTSCEGDVDEEGLFYWTTYNPDSKWDWWSLGGRWSGGKLILKEGAKGVEGEPGIFNKTTGTDMAYLKDLDLGAMEKNEYGIATFSVLDENGWHEPAKMGWFAVTYDRSEEEKDWGAKFRERFLSNPTDKTVVAIIDAHI